MSGATVELARWVIDERHPTDCWPRAASVLLRQQLENTMAEHWRAIGRPTMANARTRHQLIALAWYLPEGGELAAELRHTWVQLTRGLSRRHLRAAAHRRAAPDRGPSASSASVPSCGVAERHSGHVRGSGADRRRAGRRRAPRRPADHRRGRLGQDRGRLPARRRPARRRRRRRGRSSPSRSPSGPPRSSSTGSRERVEERLGRGGARPARRPLRRHDPRLLLPAAADSTCRATRPTTSSTRTSSTAFLAREANRLELKQLDPSEPAVRLDRRRSCAGVDVVENELLDPATMPEPFRDGARATTTTRSSATGCSPTASRSSGPSESSSDPRCAARSTPTLRHLIVDEYQDVNPAQERLIELLDRARTSSCASSATTTRRSTSGAARTSPTSSRFADRYPDVATFEITTNRRSRPDDHRRRRTRSPRRSRTGSKDDGSRTGRRAATRRGRRRGRADDEADEAGWIAELILDLARRRASPYRDIAVLVRGRAAYRAARRAVRDVRHPGPARRPHRPVRPARGRSARARPSPG